SVQYWDGSAWVALANTFVNNKEVRRFTFDPVTTTRIRVSVTAAVGTYARVVEIEAYEGSSTSARLLDEYAGLGYHGGPLGYPISNPTPYGPTGTTYQQFTNGIVTYVSGQPTAFHVGGSAPEERALAAKYASYFGI